MTFFGIWGVVGRLRDGRAQTHGGDHRASEAESEPQGTGRAEQNEQQRTGQQIEAYETAFRDRIVFSNGEEDSWIIADKKTVIDWRDL